MVADGRSAARAADLPGASRRDPQAGSCLAAGTDALDRLDRGEGAGRVSRREEGLATLDAPALLGDRGPSGADHRQRLPPEDDIANPAPDLEEGLVARSGQPADQASEQAGLPGLRLSGRHEPSIR